MRSLGVGGQATSSQTDGFKVLVEGYGGADHFAVGDAVEVKDFVTGEQSLVALAGPANRQGRIAADVIAGREARFRGTQGTAIVGLFGGSAAWTGVSEKTLRRRGDTDYEKVYIYPNSHAGYYPGARFLSLKVIFRKSDGRVLGAQAVGPHWGAAGTPLLLDVRHPGPARLLRDAHPEPERVRRSCHLRRHAVARELRGPVRRESAGATRPVAPPGGILPHTRHERQLEEIRDRT